MSQNQGILGDLIIHKYSTRLQTRHGAGLWVHKLQRLYMEMIMDEGGVHHKYHKTSDN